jgi:hypothetical protein
MAELLELSQNAVDLICKIALDHIHNVESNPNAELKNADPYDYWDSIQMNDDTYIDINVHEANFGEYTHESLHWHCTAYAVDPPTETNPYHQIDTNHYAFVFDLVDGKLTYHDVNKDELVH